MKKIHYHFSSLLIAGPAIISSTGCNDSSEPKSPNVVFILCDDIGQGDLGVYHRERTGQKEIIPTRNMDYIAENGIRFRDANTPAALSAPTRYSIMTGCNSYRCRLPWGVWPAFDEKGAVAEGQKTVGNVMQDAGYHTAFFGKWNLGGKFNKLAEGKSYKGSENWDDGWDYSQILDHYPNVLGFDYSLELPIGIQNLPLAFYENGKWLPLSKDSEITIRKHSYGKSPNTTNITGEYMKADSYWDARIVGAKLAGGAAGFIERQMKEQPGKPFFIYYCSQAVHVPHQPPDNFNGIPVKGTTLSAHGDMIFELDLQIGLIIDALKKAGVFENTLIILTSDNGGLNNRSTEATGHDSSNGFRAGKGTHYEGGTRVPFIAMWKGRIPAGIVSDERVMAHDLMAMLYDLTDLNMPEDQAMDSYNILPLMLGMKEAKGREMEFYQGGTDKSMVFRQGDWKLIIESDTKGSILGPVALFNLKADPAETEEKNLINDPAFKEKINAMYKEYLNYRTTEARTTDIVKVR